MYCRHCRIDEPVALFRCITKNGRTHVYAGCPRCAKQLQPNWISQGPLTVALADIPVGKDYRAGAIEGKA